MLPVFTSAGKITSHTNAYNIRRGQGCSLFAATPTTFSRKEPMQPKRQEPERLGPPHRPGRRTTSAVFHQREANLRLPPSFCFFAPETSKPTPDHIATLVLTQSATAPHRCAAPIPTAPPCPTSSSPAAAYTVQTGLPGTSTRCEAVQWCCHPSR